MRFVNARTIHPHQNPLDQTELEAHDDPAKAALQGTAHIIGPYRPWDDTAEYLLYQDGDIILAELVSDEKVLDLIADLFARRRLVTTHDAQDLGDIEALVSRVRNIEELT